MLWAEMICFVSATHRQAGQRVDDRLGWLPWVGRSVCLCLSPSLSLSSSLSVFCLLHSLHVISSFMSDLAASSELDPFFEVPRERETKTLDGDSVGVGGGDDELLGAD